MASQLRGRPIDFVRILRKVMGRHLGHWMIHNQLEKSRAHLFPFYIILPDRFPTTTLSLSP